MKKIVTALFLLIMVLGAPLLFPPATADEGPMIISYGPGSEITNRTPVISIQFYAEAGIDQESAVLVLDDVSVSDYFELIEIDENSFTYRVPDLLSLDLGNHSVYFEIADANGAVSSVAWNFMVVEPAPDERTATDVRAILIIIGTVIVLVGVGAAIYYAYMRRFKRFTFKKYFLRNPVKRGNLVLYVPLAMALAFVILGMLIATSNPDEDSFAFEYIVVTGLFIGIFPYALYSHLYGNTRLKYEIAFAQFLFELADSIRGGIDPARSVLSFADVEKGILRKHLRVAADGLRIGRPFDEMIELMVKPIDSPMVRRYASLIGETSKMGGDIAIVLHRAAKDMDDLIKIERDRKRQLSAQAMTIYISFAVLLIVIYQLISIYPMMGSIDGALFGGSNLEDADAATSPPTIMDLFTIKQRFLHLMIINSMGAGILIGVFTEGKPKMGLMHALIMTVASTLFFVLMIIPIG